MLNKLEHPQKQKRSFAKLMFFWVSQQIIALEPVPTLTFRQIRYYTIFLLIFDALQIHGFAIKGVPNKALLVLFTSFDGLYWTLCNTGVLLSILWSVCSGGLAYGLSKLSCSFVFTPSSTEAKRWAWNLSHWVSCVNMPGNIGRRFQRGAFRSINRTFPLRNGY